MDRTKRLNDLIKLVERCFDFQRWGFKQNYVSPMDISFPYVIYDSEWCRVKFNHNGGDYADQWKELSIHYGRSHAPNDDAFMLWHGEKCWAWHSLHVYALNFLDGLSAKEAAEKKYRPHVIEKLRESDVLKNTSSSPEWSAKLDAGIWDHYGKRLFELFDLRCPDLWERYRNFLIEVQIAEDEINRQKNFKQIGKMSGFPYDDQVC